jgi:putative acetyltransferase
MIVVRQEQAGEAPLIDAVIAAAFGRRDEARLVSALRAYTDGFASFVVVEDGEIIASAVLTPVMIEGDREALGLRLAPVAVAPPHQRRGIGTALVRHSLARSKHGGFAFVVVLGDSGYYRRFGFRPAANFGLSSDLGVPGGAFQAMELWPKALVKRSGRVLCAPEFALALDYLV